MIKKGLLAIFLTNILSLNVVYGKPLNDAGCSGLSSVVSITESTGYCYSYQIEVNYYGTGSFALDQMFVAIPACGMTENITNSEGWDIIYDVTDSYSGLQGFHISSINGFGGSNPPGNFTVDFTVCAENLVCKCDLAAFETHITYEALSCIEEEDITVTNPDQCSLDIPPFMACNDLNPGESLFEASSITSGGVSEYTLMLSDAFTSEDALFDLDQGQLVYSSSSAKLFGMATLSSGGNGLDGTEWVINIDFIETDIVDPVMALGQGPEYTETWLYYEVNDSSSYMYRTDDPDDIILLEGRANPFQIGLSAGGGDISEFSAAGGLNWERGTGTGDGVVNIDVNDLCPPEGLVSPILECVEYVVANDNYIAYFGYLNENTSNIVIPVGPKNGFNTNPPGQGQPFNFQPGLQEEVFQIEFDGSDLVWSLESPNSTINSVTASSAPAIRCVAVPTAEISGTLDLCTGESGSLNIALTGAGPWTLTYDMDGAPHEIVTDVSPLKLDVNESGIYTLVSVKDQHGQLGAVSGQGTVNISEPPSALISGGGVLCEATETAMVNIALTGISPLSIVYTDGNAVFELNPTNNNVEIEIGQGIYELVSVEDGRCSGSVDGTAEVTVDTPTATISGGGELCNTSESTLIQISWTGTGTWSAVYTDGTQSHEVDQINGSIYTFETNQPGEYTLVSVTGKTCSASTSGMARVGLTNPLSGEILVDNEHCQDESILLRSSITGDLNYKWSSNGQGGFNDDTSEFTLYTPAAGEEEVTFFLDVSDHCSTLNLTATTTIIHLNSSFNTSPDPVENGFTANLEYLFIPEERDAQHYLWTFDETTVSTQMVASHKFREAGEHEVQLTVSMSDCESITVLPIQVEDNINLYIPNVFNPNAVNEENRRVKVYGEGISQENFTFSIYNRWGGIVYNTNSIKDAQIEGWNGMSDQEGLENNVFTYIIRGMFNNGDPFEETGTITLVK